MLSRGGDVSSFPAKGIHTLGILEAEKQRVAGLGRSLSVSGELNGAAGAHGPQRMEMQRAISSLPHSSFIPGT